MFGYCCKALSSKVDRNVKKYKGKEPNASLSVLWVHIFQLAESSSYGHNNTKEQRPAPMNESHTGRACLGKILEPMFPTRDTIHRIHDCGREAHTVDEARSAVYARDFSGSFIGNESRLI